MVDFEDQLLAVPAGAAFVRQALHVFPHGGLGIVALAPGPIIAHLVGQVLDAGVPDHAIGALGDERCIELQFLQHMLMGVVGIEEHHDALVAFGVLGDLLEDLGRDRGSLQQVDLVAHRMRSRL